MNVTTRTLIEIIDTLVLNGDSDFAKEIVLECKDLYPSILKYGSKETKSLVNEIVGQ